MCDLVYFVAELVAIWQKLLQALHGTLIWRATFFLTSRDISSFFRRLRLYLFRFRFRFRTLSLILAVLPLLLMTIYKLERVAVFTVEYSLTSFVCPQ